MELTSLARITVCGKASELACFGRPQILRAKEQLAQQQVRRIGVVATLVKDANQSKRVRRPENVEGEFYVDRTCIDCDICRWMSPTVFKSAGPQSAVYHQPETSEERFAALQALLACPTSSIRTEHPPKDIKSVQASFPIPIDSQELEGVYHCGYHAESSFAATSYFIVRPEGNILVDSPRYTEILAKRLEAMGGVRYMFLTHKDDIADHDRWQARFKCDRILHELEVQRATEDVEIKLQGEGPWSLGSDIDLIFTPGHTEGCVSLLYKKGKGAIFSGDHLVGDESHGQGISINSAFNWYSVRLQIQSIRKLLSMQFTWILPGHGRRRHYSSVDERNAIIEKFLGEKELSSSN